jgi:hypothetical protein
VSSPLRHPEPHAWYPTVLVFVGAGPLAGGLAFLIETIVLQAARGAGLPPLNALPLAFRVLAVAYVFGFVPTALTGYFHFYSRSWLRSRLGRTIATCALGAALGAILPVLGGRGGVILAYALAGAIAALVCTALTAKFIPGPSDGLPPSRGA